MIAADPRVMRILGVFINVCETRNTNNTMLPLPREANRYLDQRRCGTENINSISEVVVRVANAHTTACVIAAVSAAEYPYSLFTMKAIPPYPIAASTASNPIRLLLVTGCIHGDTERYSKLSNLVSSNSDGEVELELPSP